MGFWRSLGMGRQPADFEKYAGQDAGPVGEEQL